MRMIAEEMKEPATKTITLRIALAMRAKTRTDCKAGFQTEASTETRAEPMLGHSQPQ
jgi:hypothetical protein